MASLLKSRQQNCKHCPNQSTNNGNMADKVKCDVGIEWGVSLWVIERERKKDRERYKERGREIIVIGQ